jgi:chromosome partitioning protein
MTNLTLAGIMASTHLLVPMQPSKYSIDGLRKLFTEIKKMRGTGSTKTEILGFVMNMVCPTKLHRQMVNQLKRKYPQFILDSVIHKRTAYEESPIKNKSIWQYGQDEKAELEMSALVREIIRKVEGDNGQ